MYIIHYVSTIVSGLTYIKTNFNIRFPWFNWAMFFTTQRNHDIVVQYKLYIILKGKSLTTPESLSCDINYPKVKEMWYVFVLLLILCSL